VHIAGPAWLSMIKAAVVASWAIQKGTSTRPDAGSKYALIKKGDLKPVQTALIMAPVKYPPRFTIKRDISMVNISRQSNL